MAVTLKDLAREAGVNKSTASRAINGSYGVHKETREFVLATASRLGYRTNRVARGLVTGRSNTIGLIVSDIRNPFFAELARGAEDAAMKAGLDLVLCNSDLDPDKQMRYVDSLLAKKVDGIMATSIFSLDRGQRDQLASCGVPIVLLNRVGPKSGFSSVHADCETGGALAAEYLLELGHKKLAHLAGPRYNLSLADRADGFSRKLKAVSHPIEPIIVSGQHSFDGGRELTKKLLEEHPDVTGIFAANDNMAFGAISTIVDMGLRIPEDISLIGFDNVQLCRVMHPPLTSVHQPKYEMGVAAVEILLRLAGRPETPVPEHRKFGVELIKRHSCRPLS